MTRALWLPDVLADAYRHTGVLVSVQPGWETRGRSSDFDPVGVIAHHTAEVGVFDNICRYCATGAGDAPLCQVVSRKDGREVRVIASGRCNHAGTGDAPFCGTDGNGRTIGWEAQGHPAHTWDGKHLDTQARGHAAILRQLGQPADHLIDHKEWSPSRKTDRHSIDPNRWRQVVAALMAKETHVAADLVVLYHPSQGVPDALAAAGAPSFRPDKRIITTCNAAVASDHVKAGDRVVAVGAAWDMISGDRDLRGADRIDTARQLLDYLADL